MTGDDHVPDPSDPNDPSQPSQPDQPGGPGHAGEPAEPADARGPASGPRGASDTTETLRPPDAPESAPPGPPPEPPPDQPRPGAAEQADRRFHRSRDNRVLAGVAGGMGENLGIDPVLPRVAFVVLTVFGGLGVLLYLVCWLLIPDQGERLSPAETLLGRGPRRRRALAGDTALAVTVAAVLALYVGTHHGADYALLAVVLGLGFVLYRHLEEPGSRPAAGAQPPPVTLEPSVSATWRSPDRSDDPPGDPPGVRPAGGGGPGRGAPLTSTRGDRTTRATAAVPGHAAGPRLGVVALCLALILAGLLVALDRGLGLDLSTRTVLALLLALVGATLVVGAWWGRARSLILVGVPLTVVLVVAGDPLLGGHGVDDWGARDQTWAPASVSDIPPVYRLSAGRGVLDLRNVDVADADRDVTVQMGAGELEVRLPADVDVLARGEVTVGSMTLLGSQVSGVRQHRAVTDDGVDGPGGGRLRIFAYLSFGHLEVVR